MSPESRWVGGRRSLRCRSRGLPIIRNASPAPASCSVGQWEQGRPVFGTAHPFSALRQQDDVGALRRYASVAARGGSLGGFGIRPLLVGRAPAARFLMREHTTQQLLQGTGVVSENLIGN